MELDWENLLDDWDGEDCRRNWAWENCFGPKRNLGDFSNWDCKFISKDCVATVSRPPSYVPAVLAESEK